MEPLTPHEGGSRAADTWRAAALYAALTLLLAYPLSLHPATRALPGDPDTDLFVWTLAWDAHALAHRPLGIFDANIFYPKRRTLAYSENLIGSALLVAPLLWLGGSPVLAVNLVALFSCVLCGLGAYVLARRLGMGPPGAFVCGLVFAFSPVRFFRIGQLHLTTVEWVPFGLASLHAYLDDGRRRDLRWAAGFFTLQALTSGHGAVFLGVAGLGLVVYRVALGEPIAATKRLRDLGLTGAVLLAPAVVSALPYLQVQAEVGLRRSLVNWAVPWSSFLASPAHVPRLLLSLVPGWRILETARAYLFPGILPLLLAAAAVLWPRAVGRAPDAVVRRGVWWARAAAAVEVVALAALALGAYVTAFGPVRWTVAGVLLVKAGNAWRAWTTFVLAASLRAAMARRAPFAVMPRLRRRVAAARAWARAHRRDPVTFYLLLTAGSVWLSVGPPIGVWPLVYWLPGLRFHPGAVAVHDSGGARPRRAGRTGRRAPDRARGLTPPRRIGRRLQRAARRRVRVHAPADRAVPRGSAGRRALARRPAQAVRRGGGAGDDLGAAPEHLHAALDGALAEDGERLQRDAPRLPQEAERGAAAVSQPGEPGTSGRSRRRLRGVCTRICIRPSNGPRSRRASSSSPTG